MNHNMRRRADINFIPVNQIILRANRAADDMTTLKHDDFQTAFRQITSARQTVVSAADDGDIVFVIQILIHYLLILARKFFKRKLKFGQINQLEFSANGFRRFLYIFVRFRFRQNCG